MAPAEAKRVVAAQPIDFRALAENSADVICRIDSNLMPVYVSPSSEHVLGWTPEEMILAGPIFIHPDDAAQVQSVHERLTHGGEDFARVTLRLLKRDGSVMWVEATGRPLPGPGGDGDVVIVMRDVTDRERLEEELRALSFTDGLTGLANRRAFDLALEREWRRIVRDGSEMSLLMLDLDYFKRFNDLYGHHAGDDCLRVVASAVKSAMRRASDFAARYGGEELAVILPDIDADGAFEVAERVRAAIEDLALHHAGNTNRERTVTASIGVASAFARAGGTMKMPEGLLLCADNALYKAKNGGRNRVEVGILLAAHEAALPQAS